VTVPGVRFIDLAEGVLGMEWIEGHSVRALLGGEPEQDETEEDLDGPSPSPSVLPPNISSYGVTDGIGYFSFMVAHPADWAS
jgi:TP53 regulating kinase-like protein